MADHFDFQFKVQGPGGESRFAIPLGISIVGRLVGSALLLESEQVSRKHAQIACTLTDVQVTDLNSSNGSFLNGQKLTPGLAYTLSSGDTLKIGPFSLTLEQVAIQVAAVHEESPIPEPVVPTAEEADASVESGASAAPGASVEAEASVKVETPKRTKGTKAVQEPSTRALEEEPPSNGHGPSSAEEMVPAGLSIYSQQLIDYLPGIYQTDFMRRFLGIFESILLPIEWNIDNFDLFLSPSTAPEGFLPWLANWFGITYQPGWTEAKRRELLKNAGFIYARRGTRAAMTALLGIFTGQEPQIDDTSKDLPPFTFRVKFNLRKGEVDTEQISALIDTHKPAHTSYILEFSK